MVMARMMAEHSQEWRKDKMMTLADASVAHFDRHNSFSGVVVELEESIVLHSVNYKKHRSCSAACSL